MCFFKSPSAPSPAAVAQTAPKIITPPVIAPAPSPIPTEIAPQKTAEKRRKRIEAVRYGILSTIKTSPLGIVGAGAELGVGGKGKTTLGS